MKKQTKLFAILLTLALVFGTVVVTAIATSSFGHDYAQDEQNTVDGEVIRTHINFDSLETVNYGAATEITADPTFKSDNNKTAALYYKGRNGNCSIVEATQGAANKYLHVDLDMEYHTTFPGYLSLSLGNGVSKPEHLEGRTLDDIKYHVVDFDFYAPNGYASEKGYFGALLQLRLLNQNGEIKDITTAGYRQSTAGINIRSAGVYNNYPLGWTTPTAISNTEWTHITFILETTVNDAGTPDDTADDYIDIKTYNVINGKIVSTYVFADGQNSSGTDIKVTPTGSKASNCYNSDMTQLFINEIRFEFGYSKDNADINVDNIAVRSYSNEYDDTQLAAILAQGKGAYLTGWDRNAYDPALMPVANVPGATIGDNAYANLAAALAAAQDGDTITLGANSTLSLSVDKSITIDHNGFTLSGVTAAEGYLKSGVAASGTTAFKPISEAYYKYTNSSGTVVYSDNPNFATAVSNTGANQTLYVLKDVKIDGYIKNSLSSGSYSPSDYSLVTFSNNITVELGGHTLSVAQYSKNHLSINSSKTVKFQNGTIKAYIDPALVEQAVAEYKDSEQPLKLDTTLNGHAVFCPGSNSKLWLENVDTYTAGLFNSWSGANYTVDIDGGEHHSIGKGDHWNGFFMTRAALTFTADNASFYFGSQSLIIDSAYSTNASNNPTHSYTFTGCKIVADKTSRSMFNRATNFTKITFNDCDIAASFSGATLNDSDKNAGYTAMTAGNVTIGNGTRIASGVTVNADYTSAAAGYAIVGIYKTNTITMNYVSGTVVGGEFTIAQSGKEFTFTKKVVSENDAQNNYDFLIIKDSSQTVFMGTLKESVSYASASSTIRFNHNVDLELSSHWYVSKSITFDLNTHVLTLIQKAASNCSITANLKDMTFKICNGTVKNHYNNTENSAFPMFFYSNPATYVFENVTSYTSGLVYNYGQTGVQVQFIGGEHHIVRGTAHTAGGFVDSRGNITITANGTKFYAIDSAIPIHLGSYKTAADSRSNTATFTDCFFYMPTATSRLIKMNNYTTVNFNGCTIHASLNPVRTDLDASEASSTTANPVAGSIILGEGTKIAKGATLSSAVAVADGYSKFYVPEAQTVSFNVYTAGELTAETFEFNDSFEVDAPLNARYTATISGSNIYVPASVDFIDLIKNIVDTNGEVILHENVDSTIDITFGTNNESHYYVITKNVTVDLNGNTLNMIEAHANSCSLHLDGTVKFMNGTLTVDSPTATNGGHYPLFYLSKATSNLTLENMICYSGALIYNPLCDGPTVNIIGGEYHIIKGSAHTIGGLIEARHNTNFTATGAKFYVEKMGLIGSLSYNAGTDESAIGSSFTFNECDIYTATADLNLFVSINDFTTVTFNNCNVRGNLAFKMHDFDKTAGNKFGKQASAKSLVLGAGTTIATPAGALFTAEDGYAAFSTNETYVFECTGFTSDAYALTAIVRDKSDALFTISKGGIIVCLDDSYALPDAITAADAGSVLYVHNDLRIVTDISASSSYANITKALTLDFGGNTVYLSQSINNGYCNIGIKTSSPVVIENGTFVYSINQTYIDEHSSTYLTKDMSYAMFRVFNNNATVTFNNVKAYGGAFIFSYNTTGTTVNINGGEFHIGKSVDLYGGGIAEMRANATVNVNGATICLYNGAPLMTLALRYQAGERKSTATFTDCTILGTSASHNILPTLNNYTTVRFDNCALFGSINPSQHKSDVNNENNDYPLSGPVAGSIVLGNGTYLAKDATLKENVVVAEDGRAIVETNKTYSYILSISSGSIFDIENPDFTITGAKLSFTFGLVVGEPPLKNFTVTWYQEDGHTVILIQTFVEGTVGVVAPAYVPGDNNGWYKTGFEGWTTENGSSEKVNLAEFVVNENSAFYPATKADSTPTAYLSGAEYNLTLTGNITINFYLPKTPVGVNVIGVYDENGNLIDYKGVTTPDGVYHRMYVVNTVGATALSTSNKLRVVFTVDYNGDTIELTQNVTISPIRYAKAILADSEKATPSQTAATHTLIADMVRYSSTLATTVGAERDTALEELLNKYSHLCSELPANYAFAEYTTTITDLKGYIETISFEVSKYQPRWVFTFKDTMKVVDVKVSLDGYYELPDENGYNFGSLTYELDEEASIYSGDYLTTAYMQAIPMYNVDRVITITVTTEDGTTVSGTYSLNTYFAHVNATGETLENVREFLKSFRAFGITSAGYRYAGGIKQAGAAKEDFFTCDHKATGSWTAANGRYCSDCQTYVFAYADYIANLSSTYGGKLYTSRDEALAGKVNSYSVIDYCHAMANNKYANTPNVGCYAGNFVYYLGEARDYSGTINEITVWTNTSWAGAYFIIDDSPFNENDATFKKNVFCVRANTTKAPDGTTYSNSGTNITEKIATALGTQAGERILTPSSTNIGWSSGMPMLIMIKDYSQSRYHREGVNASKAATQEVILIDELGNINPTTPIEWDYIYNPNFNSTSAAGGTTVYQNSFSATAYPITMAPVKLSGLDKNGNISCHFETIANDNALATKYDACGRNITIRAANVTVEGLEHTMTEDNDTSTPRQAYNGFVNVNIAHNVVIKDMLVDQHVSSSYTDPSTGKKVGMGSYEFAGADSVYVSWINCVSKTFFDADGSTTYRGLFGTNRMRNNYLKDCILNSYDAHSGAYNTTIEDSTFEHFNFVGQGNIIIKNVAIYVDGGYGGVILRSDYGSRWEGNVYIDGLDLRHSDEYSKHYVDLIKAEYINWDFGYTDQTETSGNFLPFNVYAKNVTVHEYTRTEQQFTIVSPGQIAEDLRESDVSLGIYSTYDNTLRTKSYNASNDANKQKPTAAIYLEGGGINSLADICTPNNAYFKNMKIYINGAQQNWYACQGSHTDENNDKYCDSCKARINCTASHSGNDDGRCSTCTATIKDTSGCVTGDTLVTLKDGTTARIDSLKDGDMILAWNFFTGKVEAVPAAKVVNHGFENNSVIKLTFDDGSVVKVVNMHQFFSIEENDFVTINQASVGSYVGKEFIGVDQDGNVTAKKLVSYEIYKECNEAYAIVSAYHYNAIVGGMLTMDFKPQDVALFRYFEIAEDMKYDEEKMAEDIATYGLFTYEEFSDYVSYEEFVAFGIQYMKVSVGKGYSSKEHMILLIERYGLGK